VVGMMASAISDDLQGFGHAASISVRDGKGGRRPPPRTTCEKNLEKSRNEATETPLTPQKRFPTVPQPEGSRGTQHAPLEVRRRHGCQPSLRVRFQESAKSPSNRSRKRFSFPAPLGSGPFRGPLFFQDCFSELFFLGWWWHNGPRAYPWLICPLLNCHLDHHHRRAPNGSSPGSWRRSSPGGCFTQSAPGCSIMMRGGRSS